MATGKEDIHIIAGLEFSNLQLAGKTIVNELNKFLKGSPLTAANIPQQILGQKITPKMGRGGNILGYNVAYKYQSEAGTTEQTSAYISKYKLNAIQKDKLARAIAGQTGGYAGTAFKSLGGVGVIDLLAGGIEKVDMSLSKVLPKQQTFNDQLGKLIQRSASVIPIWMLMRGVWTEMINIFSIGTKRLIELDAAMAKARSVVQGVKDIPEFMGRLGNEIDRLSLQTGRSVTEIGDIFYRFSETGLDAETSLAGMNTALKLSMATFSDSGEVARMMVDLYNMFGDSITEATTAQGKMEYIASTFAVLWRQNAGNLNEYIDAMKNFGGIAKSFGLSLQDTMTFVTVLHNFMQRGGTAGTQLARTFQEMTKNFDKIRLFLGKGDLQRGNWADVLDQMLNKIASEQAKGKDVTAIVLDIFGERSEKAVLALTSNMRKFVTVWKEIQSLPFEKRQKVLNELYENANQQIKVQIDRFGQLREAWYRYFVFGAKDAKEYSKALENLNNQLQNLLETSKQINAERAFKMAGPLAIGTSFGAQMAKDLKLDMLAPAQAGTVWKYLSNQFTKWGLGKKKEEDTTSIAKRMKDVITSMSQSQTEEETAWLTPEGRIKAIENLKYQGYSQLSIERQLLAEYKKQTGEKKDLQKITEQIFKIEQLQLEQIYKYSSEIRDTLKGSLGGVLTGEKSWGNLFDDFNKKIGEQARDTVAGGIVDSLANLTGIDTLFGNAFSTFKNIYGDLSDRIKSAHETVYGQIVKGHRDGLSGRGGVSPIASWSGGYGVPNIGGGLIGLGVQGLFGAFGGRGATDNFYTTGNTPDLMRLGFRKNQMGSKGNAFGNALAQGGLISSVLTGYGMYQASRASGGSRSGAVMSGVTAGLGGIAGIGAGIVGAGAVGSLTGMAALGALATSIPFIGLAVAAIALPLLATLWSSGKKSQTSITTETRTQEDRVASRIDITNKSLEIVNRNLVALRSDIRTYILPASAYFAEKNNLEAEFALMSRRGFQG